jgi:hypothetical protein
MACGAADSCSDHRALTFSSQLSGFMPVGDTVKRQEGFEEKLSSRWRYAMEVRVIVGLGVPAELTPLPPDLVLVLMCWLCFQIQEDSSVCITSKAKDKTLSGKGSIRKVFGMDCGRERWKRLVRMLSGGSSYAKGFRLPSRVCMLKLSKSGTRLLDPGTCWLERQ